MLRRSSCSQHDLQARQDASQYKSKGVGSFLGGVAGLSIVHCGDAASMPGSKRCVSLAFVSLSATTTCDELAGQIPEVCEGER